MILMRINCRRIAGGVAQGRVLLSGDSISFLGNVDPDTGIIVDPQHAIHGECIKDKVLVFPHGKGSTVGSYVIYQLSKNGVGPSAMINLESEPIVAVGSIISTIPLVDELEIDPFEVLHNGDLVRVDGTAGTVEVLDPSDSTPEHD
ncbi:MAG: DUF126 domain-containing protein [Euryarchaeota archaeon]|nr:DUF126 domain-containing protein [Euryarchaeota archaeon]